MWEGKIREMDGEDPIGRSFDDSVPSSAEPRNEASNTAMLENVKSS